MVVWLVWFTNFQSELELCGVFSTEEKAQQFIAKCDDRRNMHAESCEVDSK